MDPKNKENGAIPAGSKGPGEKSGQPDESGQQGAGQQGQQQEGMSIEALSKQLEDTRSQLDNAQQLIGRQSGEVGELRQSLAALSEELPQKKGEPDEDYDARIQELATQYESGEVEGGEAMANIARLAMEKGVKAATTAIRSEMEKTQSQEIEQKFLDQNPDFKDLVNNGSLDDIKKANPLHDDMSAYYEYKARETQAKLDEAVKQAEASGEKTGAEMAAQAKKAGNVLGKQGEGVRDKNQPASYGSRDGRRQAMAEALRNARAANS